MQGFSLEPVTFAMTDVFHGGPCPSLWSCPSHSCVGRPSVQGSLAKISSMITRGGPTRRCKLGHLFISWSELVAVADSFGRNGRIRPQRTQETFIPQLQSQGIVFCAPSTPGVNLVFCSRASDYQLAFNSTKTPIMFFLKTLIFEAIFFLACFRNKGIPFSIALHRYCFFFFFFYKLKVCHISVWSKSISAIFPTILLTPCLCHVLVIVTVFQTFSPSLHLLW